MKANITKASDISNKPILLDINTLKELIELIKKEGSIIIDGIDKNNIMNITIYDDYIE